ncbi:hypothetical protein PP515_gp45 [Gordonia phage Sidious]|uniref:DUF7323 domain-containing protein n=1 Tax=Gordonia phage Sidious TaxID=2591118 RepID=A0A515MI91_9CAUD|nr:hypothetical protein PP515_gp45 [Gordonia phage Sidious]QDM56392.1 hypothetical protein SEA_SIDIOUS_45 [Gordonia phage Sidious]
MTAAAVWRPKPYIALPIVGIERYLDCRCCVHAVVEFPATGIVDRIESVPVEQIEVRP